MIPPSKMWVFALLIFASGNDQRKGNGWRVSTSPIDRMARLAELGYKLSRTHCLPSLSPFERALRRKKMPSFTAALSLSLPLINRERKKPDWHCYGGSSLVYRSLGIGCLHCFTPCIVFYASYFWDPSSFLFSLSLSLVRSCPFEPCPDDLWDNQNASDGLMVWEGTHTRARARRALISNCLSTEHKFLSLPLLPVSLPGACLRIALRGWDFWQFLMGNILTKLRSKSFERSDLFRD